VNPRRLLLSPLWFLVALLSIIGLDASSAAAAGGPETRVRAIEHATADSVAAISSERPASVGCLRPSNAAMAVGACVATDFGDEASRFAPLFDAVSRHSLGPARRRRCAAAGPPTNAMEPAAEVLNE
jgi:hypothetical protein